MIIIDDKHNCCGCAACVQICPQKCITFEEDKQGFRYPLVDTNNCVDCGLCTKVCPVINRSSPRYPLNVYAAINPNEEIRMRSSSGGIFTLLAESIIQQGGVVFGARFDENWEVEHSYAETVEDIEPFCGSKYVQSRIGTTYVQVKDFLQKGRVVLYTGTPCQIAGLKKYLRRDYSNLLTVDIVCHGVPSALVWRTYLKEVTNHTNKLCKNHITGISFRDKSSGWKNYKVLIHGESDIDKRNQTSSTSKNKILLQEDSHQNLYMQLFLNDYVLRPSCYNCPAKSGSSESDLTIADYWGISNIYPEFDDNKGTSLVLIYTNSGQQAFNTLMVKKILTSYQDALKANSSIELSVSEKANVAYFWKIFSAEKALKKHKIKKLIKTSIIRRMYYRLIRCISRMIK